MAKRCEHPLWHCSLFDAAKGTNALLLVEAVEVLKTMLDADVLSMMGVDYSKIDVHTLFTREPFMHEPWLAEQWLVCLSVCLLYCTRRFPRTREFKHMYNWLNSQVASSDLCRLSNAVVLISGGRATKTLNLDNKVIIQYPFQWDVS